jgi:hypothetical protein
MKRQTTAVEWLEMEIVKLEDTYAIPSKIYELCEKAKEMFELQIIEAHDEGEGKIIGRGKDYYNETY